MLDDVGEGAVENLICIPLHFCQNPYSDSDLLRGQNHMQIVMSSLIFLI